MKRALVTVFVLLASACLAGQASAQISGGGGGNSFGGSGGGNSFGGGGGNSFGGGGRGGGSGKPGGSADQPPPLPDIKPQPEPRQRLDPGALLCPTEGLLRQHQQAVAARLAGGFAPEPKGCRIVRATIAVSVAGRDGPAATEVNLPGATPGLGWTDSRLRDASGAR